MQVAYHLLAFLCWIGALATAIPVASFLSPALLERSFAVISVSVSPDLISQWHANTGVAHWLILAAVLIAAGAVFNVAAGIARVAG